MKIATISNGEQLAVNLVQTKGDGRLLAREPVLLSDLHLARDEVFLHGMSTGVLSADLSALTMQVLPGENRGAERLAGYAIELSGNGRSFRRSFLVQSLAHVGRRAARALLKDEAKADELLKEDSDISFYLSAVRADVAPEPADEFTVARRPEPQVFEPASLADYLRDSEVLPGSPAASAEKETLPVFVTRQVWDEGHELARAGGERESAAVWTGRLMRDTASPRLFMSLDACIKAEHAAEEKFSVTFSGETWAKVRQLLDLRRQRLGRPHERIVGSVHGHNFYPEADEHGQRMCQACATREICTRTTASASLDDLDWHRAVFVGQPWALLLVWGHTAREEEEWRLYGLAEATLQPRSIRLLKA